MTEIGQGTSKEEARLVAARKLILINTYSSIGMTSIFHFFSIILFYLGTMIYSLKLDEWIDNGLIHNLFHDENKIGSKKVTMKKIKKTSYEKDPVSALMERFQWKGQNPSTAILPQ